MPNYLCPGCGERFQIPDEMEHDAREILSGHLATCDGPYANDIECDSCHFKTRNLTAVVGHPPGPARVEAMCDVCYNTLIGNASLSPHLYNDPALMSTIGYVTNMILKRIAETGDWVIDNV